MEKGGSRRVFRDNPRLWKK